MFAPPSAPPFAPLLAPPQQLFGRGLRPRWAFGSPLKSNGGSEHLYIESPGTNSIWPIRQRRLARHMPGLFQKMRQSGNRIMNPLDLIPCETVIDALEDPMALDYLMNGIARPYRARGVGLPSPTGGQDIDDYFQQCYAAAIQSLGLFGPPSLQFDNCIEEALVMFRRLAGILRHDFACGFGNDIYIAIIGWAFAFMPLAAQAAFAMYDLIMSLYTMTDKDEATLRSLIAAVPPNGLNDLLLEAWEMQTREQSFVSLNIERVLFGQPLVYPR